MDRVHNRRASRLFMSVCWGVGALMSVAGARPAIAGSGDAGEPNPTSRMDGPIFSLTLENDLVVDTDRHYTSGVRLTYQPSDADTPSWVGAFGRWFPLFPAGATYRVAWSVGQDIFTPRDIGRNPPDPEDRPYAGWLNGSAVITAWEADRLDLVRLTLGIVGPPSLAAETQEFVHTITGSDQPRGWGSQLETEPGVVLTYERHWLGLGAGTAFGLEFDLHPWVGATVGNVFTHANGGVSVRIGQRLPQDAGPPRRGPGIADPVWWPSSVGTVDWYLFAGIEGRLVARNLFLDGNSFTDSPSVDKYPVTGDFQVGLAVTIGNARLSYTHVLRTPQFRGQTRFDQFGGFTVAVRF